MLQQLERKTELISIQATKMGELFKSLSHAVHLVLFPVTNCFCRNYHMMLALHKI